MADETWKVAALIAAAVVLVETCALVWIEMRLLRVFARRQASRAWHDVDNPPAKCFIAAEHIAQGRLVVRDDDGYVRCAKPAKEGDE